MNNSKFKFPHKFQFNEKSGSHVKSLVKESVKLEEQKINEDVTEISYDSTNHLNI